MEMLLSLCVLRRKGEQHHNTEQVMTSSSEFAVITKTQLLIKKLQVGLRLQIARDSLGS